MENWTSRIAVVEHASEQGFWRIDCLAPADRLAPFVRRFNAYAENETGFVRRRELPSGLATLVFNLTSAVASRRSGNLRASLQP
jgi:hypothetical protein